ncbi:MAG TPA: recombinase family protein [Devosia sp.]|nr:recombinase family protein [Devosia sp.]
MSEKKTLRCAVYTRKSSEEGLEQDFNSLEAQREACEAYVRSQANEGWTLIDDRFDDGGFSGGNIQRPGLEALMKMVRDGNVDVIVIYKIDRLTRSLTDFARLAETFDKHGVSFVSVTQQFNTTTSMGRLMLNVLLSFAQFEREITGERIRDKIAASKKKGMWMGGNPPMGLDAVDRKLVINGEADTVRRIFSLYLEEGTVPALLDRLVSEDIRTTKRAIGSKGRTIGGKLFTRGHVYKLLTNPIYIGRISHKGAVHPGQHEAIIDLTTWAAVQQKLADNTQGARTRRRRALQRESLLAGLLVSERGNRFVPMHATKGSRRYRYYVEELPRSTADHGARLEAVRLPAPEIEAATVDTIAGFLRDGGELMRQLADLSPDQARLAVKAAREVSERLSRRGSAPDQLVKSLVKRLVFRRETLRVELSGSAMRHALLGEQGTNNDPEGNRRDGDEPDVILSSPIDFKRRGVQLKLVVDGERSDRALDLPLVTAVSRAHCWAQMLMSGEARSIDEIAEREAVGATYVGQLLPLGFLSPAVVDRILRGVQPAEATAARLVWKTEVPLQWQG